MTKKKEIVRNGLIVLALLVILVFMGVVSDMYDMFVLLALFFGLSFNYLSGEVLM